MRSMQAERVHENDMFYILTLNQIKQFSLVVNLLLTDEEKQT